MLHRVFPSLSRRDLDVFSLSTSLFARVLQQPPSLSSRPTHKDSVPALPCDGAGLLALESVLCSFAATVELIRIYNENTNILTIFSMIANHIPHHSMITWLSSSQRESAHFVVFSLSIILHVSANFPYFIPVRNFLSTVVQCGFSFLLIVQSVISSNVFHLLSYYLSNRICSVCHLLHIREVKSRWEMCHCWEDFGFII